MVYREHSGSVVKRSIRGRGPWAGASPASLCCVLEQDTFKCFCSILILKVIYIYIYITPGRDVM